MTIFPVPYKTVESTGKFNFGPGVNALISDSFKNEEAIELLGDLWTNFTLGVGKLNITKSAQLNENQFLIVNKDSAVDFAPLEDGFDYNLQVTEDRIMIEGVDVKGLIHGFSTLMQTIKPVNLEEGKEIFAIDCVSISDKPALGFRGVHVCVFPETTLNFLRKVIRLSGLMKYSHIVLEFWGMLKYDVMPELSWENAYTKDQIRPLIKDANALGMEVIPMFNHLGHATQSRVMYGKHVVLDQNPKKALLFEPDGWTWCLSNPESLALLREIRKELMELCGPSEYFHLGCDEAYSFATCDICKNTDKHSLLVNYLNGLSEELKQDNRRAIIWGDMLLDRAAWGPEIVAYSRPDQRTHEIIDRLDKSIMIADWQYNIQEPKLPTSEHFMEKGFDVVACPWHNWENVLALSQATKAINAFGFLATTWHTLNERIVLIPYAASTAWCTEENLNKIEAEQLRTTVASLQRKLVPVNGVYENAGWNRNEIQN